MPPEEPFGSSAVLRVAGLPIRYWLSAASPALFARVRILDRARERHRACGRRLAARIGRELVPHPGLTRDDRAAVLAVRRLLHSGAGVAGLRSGETLRLAGSAGGAGSRLVAEIAAVADRERELAKLAAELDQALAEEQRRLLRLPGEVLADSAVARAILPDRTSRPLPAGAAGKRDRKRLGYEWRCLTRAATGSTPRDWLSHVALLPVAGTARSLVPLEPGFAALWQENVRAARNARLDPPDGWPAPTTALAVNPLHWTADGHWIFVVPDLPDHPALVSLRDTRLLAALLAVLAGGASTFADLASAVPLDLADREALAGFVRHLRELGILEPDVRPCTHLVRRAVPGRTFAAARTAGRAGSRDPLTGTGPDAGSGWVDVYRATAAALPAATCTAIQHGVALADRFLRLLDPPVAAPRLPDRVMPFPEVLRRSLAAGPAGGSGPAGADSALAGADPADPTEHRLVRALAERAGGDSPLDVDAALLGALGAPAAPADRLDWPVDCLLRVPAPGAGYVAVLDQLRPAATVDSRFVEALTDLHGRVAQVDAYRMFLRRLAERTGLRFVELLVPPLADGAANAVRRPVYTRAWTGDPHTGAYLPAGADPGRYIPLSAIRIRRSAGRLQAEAHGRPIWPVYHATRSFSPPWDRIARLLLAAAPPAGQPVQRRLTDPFQLFPGRRAAPRIIAGRVVLSPAQWLVASGELWDPAAPLAAKVRALGRLRQRRGLPRWVRVQASVVDGPSQPCDLESLPAIRALERLGRTSGTIRMAELLPTPDELLVVDGAHRPGDRLVSELLLRLPWDEGPTALADRLAPRILASLSGDGEDTAVKGGDCHVGTD